MIPKSFDDAVVDITKETLKYRQENNIKRNDYFETMSQIPNATTSEIAGHLAGLIVDGYETSSTVIISVFSHDINSIILYLFIYLTRYIRLRAIMSSK